jgi:hypothetical protein
MVPLLNFAFDEKFNSEKVKVRLGNSEFITHEFDVLRGDAFFDVWEEADDVDTFHMEVQMRMDGGMIVRLLRYGFHKAVEKQDGTFVFVFPKQAVIVFEKNEKLGDTLVATIKFPGDQEVRVTAKVIKYWKYDRTTLVKENLIPLLPLQLFKLRELAREVEKSGESGKILEAVKEELKALYNEVVKLYNKKLIMGEDYEILLSAMEELLDYLNKNFIKEENLESEVRQMFDWATPAQIDEAREKGLEEGLEQGLEKGLEQGLEKGLEQGLEKGREEERELMKRVYKLLKQNVSDEVIVVETGVSTERLAVYKVDFAELSM